MPREDKNPNPIEVIWEDPPARPYARGQYDEAMREIKRNQGRWAKIRVFEEDSAAYRVKKDLMKSVSYDNRWEASVERIEGEPFESQRRSLYVRYRNNDQMNKAIPARNHLRED